MDTPLLPGTCQKLTAGATSVQSAAFGKNTKTIRIYAMEDCHVKLGAAPVALADGTSLFVPASTEMYLKVAPSSKLAVIQSTVGGAVYITEVIP